MKNQKPISECFNPKACKLQKFEFEFEFEKAAQICLLKNFLEIYDTKIQKYFLFGRNVSPWDALVTKWHKYKIISKTIDLTNKD